MKRKLLFFLVLLLLLLLFRFPILRGIGSFLNVATKAPEKIETLFVLSGGGLDRGAEAARLFHDISIEKIICTGENYSPDLLVFSNDSVVESTLTKMRMVNMGVPDSIVHLLVKGTSTIEESEVILKYCLTNQIKYCYVLSSNFHTRRVKFALSKKFKKNDIQLKVLGAPSTFYDETKWWASEEGLISVNNEYIKLLVYWIKY
jgi:uncharacterized SAM-binding protein YcdF (DUF218 family)